MPVLTYTEATANVTTSFIDFPVDFNTNFSNNTENASAEPVVGMAVSLLNQLGNSSYNRHLQQTQAERLQQTRTYLVKADLLSCWEAFLKRGEVATCTRFQVHSPLSTPQALQFFLVA